MNNPFAIAVRKFQGSIGSATNEAYAIAELVLDQLKVPELKDKISIEWNNKFVSKAGDARLNKTPIYDHANMLGFGPTLVDWKYGGRIRLGTKYFAIASEADKTETIVHEVCHIVSSYHWNTIDCLKKYKYESHGFEWKAYMRAAGYPNAQACHAVDMRGFKTYYKYLCLKCGKTGRLTAQMGGRMIKSGQARMCPVCKAHITSIHLTKFSGSELVSA